MFNLDAIKVLFTFKNSKMFQVLVFYFIFAQLVRCVLIESSGLSNACSKQVYSPRVLKLLARSSHSSSPPTAVLQVMRSLQILRDTHHSFKKTRRTKRGGRRKLPNQSTIPVLSHQFYKSRVSDIPTILCPSNLLTINTTSEPNTHPTFHTIPIHCETTDFPRLAKGGVNLKNLTKIDTNNNFIERSTKCNIMYFNAHSVCNKTTRISDLIVESNADIVFITETWLTGKGDEVIKADLRPPGYKLHSNPRCTGRGGGVCVIYIDLLV